MATLREWIIGAAASSDIVVDQPAVSSRHCRLMQTERGFLIEDLGSTNGTYVNGLPIDAPQQVTPRDNITLGSSIPFPWPDLSDSSTTREIRIGRAPENHVVLDSPTVSARHAKIIVNGDSATIEDLNSSNGTSLNSIENRITRAPLSRDDTVFFGSRAYAAAELLEAPGEKVPGPMLDASPEDTAIRNRRLFPLSAVLGASLVILTLALIWTFWRSPASPSPEPPGASSQPEGPQVAETLFAVVVGNEAPGSAPVPIGNAFAVSEHHMVTSANTALALEQALEEHATAVIHCPASGDESTLQPEGLRIAPEFRSAYQRFTAARHERTSLLEKLQDGENPPAPEEIEKLEEKLIDADWRLVEAAEQMTYYNLAVIEVQESLSVRLPLVNVEAKLGTQTPVTLWGYPGSAGKDESYRFTSGRQPQKASGRLRNLPVFKQGSRLFRLTVGCQGLGKRQTWFGGPVLNEDQQVIGVFSDWSVDPEKPDSPPTGKRFEAAWIGLLRQIAPEVWHSIRSLPRSEED